MATPGSSSTLPTSIGRYRILSRLGKGAMGVVFAARDEQMDRDVAIKVMTTGLEHEPETRARFFREAQVTSKLLHRNIVTLLDLGEDQGRPFIVMELLSGATLSQALKESQYESLEAKLDLMVQMCEGLSKAHSAGVIHRDIKPSNLFVLADGSLKILDFGIARLASSNMTRTGLVVGTPDYMSPEQAKGGQVDARSDVFSAAAVFYFMLTGRKPFYGPDLASALRRVMRDDPDPLSPSEAPPPLAQVITRALQKDPNARYARCSDVAADLVKFKRNFDTETRSQGSAARKQFAEVQQMAGEIQALRTQAGLPESDLVGGQQAALRERYPFLDSQAGAPVALPIRRNRLSAIKTDLDAASSAFAAELQTLRAESLERARKLDALTAEISTAIHEARFDRAQGLLKEARDAGMSASQFTALENSLNTERLVTESIDRARAACASGDWLGALSRLSALASERPELTRLADELAKLRATYDEMARLAAREAEASALSVEAERLLAQGDLAGALRSAERALSIDPAQASGLRIRAAALARREERAQTAVSESRARAYLTTAVVSLAQSQFAKAIQDARAASALCPDDERARSIAREASRLAQAFEAVDARRKAARERDREVQRLATAARASLASGEYPKALREAEAALALDAGSDIATAVADQARCVLALRASEDDETLSLEPENEGVAALGWRLVNESRRVAKDVGRRLAARLPKRGS